MALCNHSRSEINFKIVYCGTPQGGKTANLQYINRKLDPHFHGGLTTENASGPFQDFLPVKASSINGYRTNFHLYTVNPDSGSEGLQGVDGIVFVADSDPARIQANIEAHQNTRQTLERSGLDPDEIPFVFQYNKRDLPNPTAPDLMDELLAAHYPAFLTCAISGYQIFATFDHITQIVLKNFHSSAVNGRERIEEENVASSSKIALSR